MKFSCFKRFLFLVYNESEIQIRSSVFIGYRYNYFLFHAAYLLEYLELKNGIGCFILALSFNISIKCLDSWIFTNLLVLPVTNTYKLTLSDSLPHSLLSPPGFLSVLLTMPYPSSESFTSSRTHSLRISFVPHSHNLFTHIITLSLSQLKLFTDPGLFVSFFHHPLTIQALIHPITYLFSVSYYLLFPYFFIELSRATGRSCTSMKCSEINLLKKSQNHLFIHGHTPSSTTHSFLYSPTR